MSEQKAKPGAIAWTDLTVPDAERLRDFYGAVAGWRSEPVSMGDYNDFVMAPVDGPPVAGVCHARGANAGLPPHWLIYINVTDLDSSLKRCVELGGKIVAQPRSAGGHGRYAVIEDPAGAVAALFEPAADTK